jgi:hypothetical protein
MDKKKLAKMIKDINKIKTNIAKERDRLRDIISENEDICDSADEGLRELQSAIDTLSQFL